MGALVLHVGYRVFRDRAEDMNTSTISQQPFAEKTEDI